MPRGVVFDATGTLIEATESVGDVYQRVALEHGIVLGSWRLDDAFGRVLRHAPPRGIDGEDEQTRRDGEVEWWFELIRQTFQAADSAVLFDDFGSFAQTLFDAYRAPTAWRVRDRVLPLLSRLRDQGTPMTVVSNFDYRLLEILEALELTPFFTSIELPCKHGARKPDVSLFEAAGRSLGRAITDLIYIGDDSPDRLTAIRGHGLDVIDVNAVPDPKDWLTDLH